MNTVTTPPRHPARTIRRWRQHLANERAEAATYRYLAARRGGEEREILLELAEAEGRHERHWLQLLGDQAGRPARVSLGTRMLAFLARRFSSVFVLALIQSSEARSPYADDPDATAQMAADEQVHEEVVRALAARGRNRLSGTFRAAVFGANDGLVSNLSLVVGVGASGVSPHIVLLTGTAGLLAGALSMGAGEYISVRSQRELLAASAPKAGIESVLLDLDLDENELALLYRSRGMAEEEARGHAADVLRGVATMRDMRTEPATDPLEALGTGRGAALSSFCFFASGAVIPLIPYLLGLTGLTAILAAAGLVGVTLLATGAIVGVLSGAPPLRRALRQLSIGYSAAAVTYLLGLLFGTSIA